MKALHFAVIIFIGTMTPLVNHSLGQDKSSEQDRLANIDKLNPSKKIKEISQFRPVLNPRQSLIRIGGHRPKTGKLKVFVKDSDNSKVLGCEIRDLYPNRIQLEYPQKSCGCNSEGCFITGFLIPEGYSGDIKYDIRFKDDGGWGEWSFQRVYHPIKTQYWSTDIIYVGALGLIFISVLILAYVFFTEEEQFKAGETLEEADQKQTEQKMGLVLKVSRPFFKRYFSPVVVGMKGMKRKRGIYKKKIASAGLSEVITPDDFFAFKLFLIIGFPLLYMGLRAFLATEGEEPWPLSLIPLTAVVGFFYPDLWIKSAIKNRQMRILLEMPFIVDMLALSVEAGLDTVGAIGRIIEKAPQGALKEEFEILLKEVKVGASRAEAFRNLSWRVDLIQITSFCATLIAADSVGAPIPPILKALSIEVRQKRSTEAEKKGAAAATKILFPTIFLIIPAVFIVIGAPIALEAMLGQ